MSLPSLPSAKLFFFFENAKISVGRTTLSREKKGDGLTWPSIINYFNDDLELHYWNDTQNDTHF